jgi:hypothetical protein
MTSIVVVSKISHTRKSLTPGTARLSLVVLFQFAPMLMGLQFHKLNQFKKIFACSAPFVSGLRLLFAERFYRIGDLFGVRPSSNTRRCSSRLDERSAKDEIGPVQ